MPIPPIVGSTLPPGRFPCTQAEIAAEFVNAPAFSASTSRSKIWADWQAGVALLTSAVKVHSAWVSGSFISSKMNPGDIDALFIVSAEDRAKRSTADLKIIESFELRVAHPLTGQPVPPHGLSVDSFIIGWEPHSAPAGGGVSQDHADYAVNRGYWDDWWSRLRVTPKGSPSQRIDALPARGYLEVSFSAYT